MSKEPEIGGTEPITVDVCTCERTKSPPFCDDSHEDLQ